MFVKQMQVDKLIALLRRLGVDEHIAHAVRAEIENDPTFGMVPPERGQAAPDEERREQGHVARILAERDESSRVRWPKSWEEATAQVPGLRRWAEVKREGLAAGKAVRDILIGHLRDQECGLGHWAASGTDFPVSVLRHFDQTLRHDIGNSAQWDFPEDICLVSGTRGRPVGSRDSEPRAPRVPMSSEDEVRAARRILRRSDRAARRER